MIEWAKAQGRPVTKKELAEQLGRARLSPSYFLKYPELGQYIEPRRRKDIETYTNILYNWLRVNDIPYKPGDRTRLGVTLDALLLEEYSNIAIQIYERPYSLSRKVYQKRLESLTSRAEKMGLRLILLNKDELNELNKLKIRLNELKK